MGIPLLARLVPSLAALPSGWAAVNLAYFFYLYLLGVEGQLFDVAPWLFYTGLFALGGWFGTVLPIVVLVPPTSWLFRLPWGPLASAFIAATVFNGALMQTAAIGDGSGPATL